jgi:glycosyltransferase involved in cell wall biosynthesis
MSKGIDYLVEAIPQILQQHPDSMLIFNLIPAKRDKKMKKRIKAIGKSEQIHIFSEQPQSALRELVATADLIIAPSLAEGFGSVHSEACAMGKVLLTTQIAAIPEVVSGPVKLIPPRSSEAIVQGIKEIRIGKVKSTQTKSFVREKSVKKIEKLYQC